MRRIGSLSSIPKLPKTILGQWFSKRNGISPVAGRSPASQDPREDQRCLLMQCGQMMNIRDFERRRLDAQVVIRYVALDGRSVEQVIGRTLDISRGGLGVRAKLSLRRQTPVYLSVTDTDGNTTNFTGMVAHSRPDDEGAYLIGIQLCKIRDERLLRMLDPARADEVKTESNNVEPVREASTADEEMATNMSNGASPPVAPQPTAG